MGALKFYKPGQAFWEATNFATASFTSSTSGNYPQSNRTVRYAEELEGHLFTDKELTTVASGYKYPYGYSYSASSIYPWQFPFNFNNTSQTGSSNYYVTHFGSSNQTHDLSRKDASNKNANATILSTIIDNGKLIVNYQLTNILNEETIVYAIERIGTGTFAKTYNSSGTQCRFLYWAYYLDEPVVLAPGTSDVVSISITLSDLTQ